MEQFIPVPPRQWRHIVVSAYRGGMATWGQTFCELFNTGWCGPMDRDGFPTRLA